MVFIENMMDVWEKQAFINIKQTGRDKARIQKMIVQTFAQFVKESYLWILLLRNLNGQKFQQ